MFNAQKASFLKSLWRDFLSVAYKHVKKLEGSKKISETIKLLKSTSDSDPVLKNTKYVTV